MVMLAPKCSRCPVPAGAGLTCSCNVCMHCTAQPHSGCLAPALVQFPQPVTALFWVLFFCFFPPCDRDQRSMTNDQQEFQGRQRLTSPGPRPVSRGERIRIKISGNVKGAPRNSNSNSNVQKKKRKIDFRSANIFRGQRDRVRYSTTIQRQDWNTRVFEFQ